MDAGQLSFPISFLWGTLFQGSQVDLGVSFLTSNERTNPGLRALSARPSGEFGGGQIKKHSNNLCVCVCVCVGTDMRLDFPKWLLSWWLQAKDEAPEAPKVLKAGSGMNVFGRAGFRARPEFFFILLSLLGFGPVWW